MRWEPPVTRFWSVAEAAGRSSAAGSCGCGQQVAHSDQVVSVQREGEHPADPRQAAMASFAQTRDRLEPTVDLFDSFALALTCGVARMAGGARVMMLVGLHAICGVT